MRLRLALVQALFAVLVAGGLSFGATRVIASDSVEARSCPALGYAYPYSPCDVGCAPYARGYCSEEGRCICVRPDVRHAGRAFSVAAGTR